MPEASPPVLMLDVEAQRRAIGPLMEERLWRVLEHGKFVMGPEVHELEETLAERAGVAHVVTCGNGTDALQLVLMAWGIGPGDAVFVPSFTFTATAEVVALLGATPVFCDVSAETYNLDVVSLEAAIRAVRTEGSLTPKVIIPVDLFGLPADYNTIQQVADRHGLWVLADAAQSFGATFHGRPVGGLAAATATSFFPAKPLGCYGDGGAVFTEDADLAATMRSLRVHGKGTDKYDTVQIGMNSRLDTIQAAVLLAKLSVFDAELAARQEIAARYVRELTDVDPVGLPSLAKSAWAQFTVRLRRPTLRRPELMRMLEAAGVPTAIYYPRPLHEQPAFRSLNLAAWPTPSVSSQVSRTVLSLPMHPYLSRASQEKVVRSVRESLQSA